MKKKKQTPSHVLGPTGRRTNRYKNKSKKARPSADELLTLLNENGPVRTGIILGVSKVTIHALMNHYGIESKTTWSIVAKKQGTDLSATN